MNNKEARFEALKGYVNNRADCNNQQLINTNNTFGEYLQGIEDIIKRIKKGKAYPVDELKSIIELASRLRVLVELRILYTTGLSSANHIQKELGVLENER